MASPSRQLEHVPALDGLRGIAVLLVLLFHSGFSRFSGGFLGVSTFFTLSGYLVASMLITEHQRSGSIHVTGFYERRLRRLLPAALAAVVACLAVGRILGAPADPHSLGWHAVSSSSFWTNWRFVGEGKSYGALFATPSPFDHFWSLAIEAQLYVVAPLIVVLGLGLTRGRRRWPLAGLFLALAVASVACSILLFHPGADNGRVYYGTDTRAAEFLIGAALAVVLVPAGSRARQRRAGVIAALVGTAAIAGSIAMAMTGSLVEPWVYRGGFALNAVLIAAVIWAITARAPVLSSTLGVKPLAWLGTISFGVYLYHWPIFLLLTTTRTGLGRWPTFGVRLAATLALATLSAALLERPIRRGAGARWWAVSPAALVAVVTVCVLVVALAPPSRPSVAAADVNATSAPPTVPTSTPHTFTVTTVGDAEGQQLGRTLASASTATVRYDGIAGLSGDWASTWAQQVKDNGADALLLSVSAWDPAAGSAGLGGPAPNGDQLEPWLTARLSALVDSLTQDGTTVVWVPLPDPNGDDLKKMAIDPTHAAFVRSFRTVFGNGGIDARFLDIQSEYNDRVREGSSTDRIGSVADLVAPRLTAIAQSTQPGVTRVVVLGDSVARSLGNGLSGWAAAEGSAAVWDLSHDGCGVWTAGDVQSLYAGTGPLPTSCTDGVDRWSREIADYRPEVVIVLSTIWDLADRKLPEWKRFRHPGDPVFDDALLARYRELIGQANAAGARVVWMTAPCTDPDNGGLPFGAPKARAAFDPVRTAHLNRSVLPQLGSEVRVVDLFSLVCPGGRFTETVGPVTGARPDGLHFSESGARWLADTYASDWLGTGRSPA